MNAFMFMISNLSLIIDSIGELDDLCFHHLLLFDLFILEPGLLFHRLLDGGHLSLVVLPQRLLLLVFLIHPSIHLLLQLGDLQLVRDELLLVVVKLGLDFLNRTKISGVIKLRQGTCTRLN